MNKHLWLVAVICFLLAACGSMDSNVPLPVYETGVDPDAWALVPAGDFLLGQQAETATIDYDYEMMVGDVTNAQYAAYLNRALDAGEVSLGEGGLLGYYPGDVFHGGRHEERIEAGNYVYVPLDDPSSRLEFDGEVFSVRSGYENHPATMISWFGAKAYCEAYGWRLPGEVEWEKAARGVDGRAYPWGNEIAPQNANFYSSRDPFEDMQNLGSRTTPVGFFNGQIYNGYQTIDSPSPYGLYDMAGNVWQWTGDVYTGQHYRYMRGGSKDTYDYVLRVWMRNNATPTYTSPGVGFRCARDR
jgi:formylglycine-generating enzyme required for sulfatase activity